MSDVSPPVIVTPTSGVDGRVALATAVHAAPGVYAVLVGSGMSSAAGVPTGWQVVQDLIRKVALAEGVNPAEVEDDPRGGGQSRAVLIPATTRSCLRWPPPMLPVRRSSVGTSSRCRAALTKRNRRAVITPLRLWQQAAKCGSS